MPENVHDESDLDPNIRAAFDEIGAVLDRRNLGGTVFAISSEESAGWVMHYPKWVLVQENGEYFELHVQHPLGPTEARKHAKLTIEYLDTLLSISEESYQRIVFIHEHATTLFARHGLIEVVPPPLTIEDADEEHEPTNEPS
jgi:hypothetical protein